MNEKMLQSFKDAVGGESEGFHSDVGRVELKDILDEELIIKDAVVMYGYTTSLGDNDFALLLCEIVDRGEPQKGKGKTFTTLCGGRVVVKKVQKAIDGNLLPLVGTISKVDSKVKGHSPYYDIN